MNLQGELSPLGPEPSASANSATWACLVANGGAEITGQNGLCKRLPPGPASTYVALPVARPTQPKEKKPERRSVAVNRKGRFRFEVLETVEAGMVLLGTEVKALRQGQMSIEEAFGRVFPDGVYLVGAHIPEYSHGNAANHEPNRKRKLLLRAREVRRLQAKVAQKGLTLVPLEVYFSERGYAKVALGLCKGRKVHDKREKIRSRDDRRTGDE